MRILLINSYLNVHGGADACFFNTARILERHGHEVQFFCMKHPDNHQTKYSDYFCSYQLPFGKLNILGKIGLVSKYIYSFETRRNIGRLFSEEERPDVAHIHNFSPHISPSVIHELKKHKVPVVMTLHDYKMTCPASFLFVKNRICQKCKGKKYYNALFNKCINNSISRSLVTMLTYYLNDSLLDLFNKIDTFISPSKFLISKLKELGFKKEIDYLSNPIDLQNYSLNLEAKEKSIIFFGRLTQEKGLDVLLDAVKGLDIKLKIVGEGPEGDRLKKRAEKEKISNIIFLGWLSNNALVTEIQKSMFTVLPSIWYENCPYSILESFALGRLVIGSKIGGIPELVIEGETGLTFNPGDSRDLRDKIVSLIDKPDLIIGMGRKAKESLKKDSNIENYYNSLLNIYNRVVSI
ncbi:MAG: glycosyltransferase family 4 protein [Candidatus Omnitrophica bacterium]|nr:glycosyltransferase family 4 protein [Candidatus Omnitrophota bacterium]